MERCFAEQRLPQVLAQIVATIKRNVVNQDTLVRFLEGFRSEFFFQESYLLMAQLGEVVQSGVFAMVVRLVFATIQHHDAGVAPIESPVGLSAYIIEVLAEADGVGVADFMVTSYK